MKKLHTRLAVCVVCAAMLTTLAACGGNNNNDGNSAASNAGTGSGTNAGANADKEETKAEPTDVTITTITFAESPPNDLEAIKQINEKLNINLKVNYIPANNITEKLTALLAGNNLTDVMFVEDLNLTPTYANAIDQGAFWDLTDYIKDYPNLAAYPENIWSNVKYKGKIMSLPRVRPLNGQSALMFRQDWLDKLGLKAPTTMEELDKVLTAFTQNDPDGNGKKDTYGAVFMGSPNPNLPYYMFGTGTNWKDDGSGNLIPDWWTPQFKDNLAFFSEEFKKGNIIPDMPVLKSVQVKENILQNKAGMWYGNVNDGWNFQFELNKTNPNAVIKAYPFPAAADGKTYYNEAPGFYGQLFVSKKVSEEKLKKILEFYDYTATKEGYDLISYGIKDKDYTVDEAGFITQTDAGKAAGYGQTNQMLSGYFNEYGRAEAAGMPADVREYNHQLVDSIKPNAIPDPTYGLPATDGFKERGADWNKKRFDMIVNVTIGQSSLEDWDKFVETFKKDANFKKHVEDTNAMYKEKVSQQ